MLRPPVGAGVPAGRVRSEHAGGVLAEGHEGRPSGGQQPLVAAAHRQVEGAGVDREPADRLGEVDERPGSVRRRRRADRLEVGQGPVGGLDGGDRDEGRVVVDGVGEPVQRRLAHADAAPGLGEEREADRRELALGAQDLAAGRQRGGDEPDEGADLASDRDRRGRDAHQCRVAGPRPFDHVIECDGVGPAGAPLLQGAGESLDGAARGQAQGGGVAVDDLGAELRVGLLRRAGSGCRLGHGRSVCA